MNDQNSMINQGQMINLNHPQMANHPDIMSQSQVIIQPQPQVVNQPQVINQSQFMNQSQLMNHSQIMSQSQAINHQNFIPQPQALQQSQMIMNNQSQPPMMSGSYKVWSRPLPPVDPNSKYRNFQNPNYVNLKQPRQGRGNWKGKNVPDKRINNRRPEKPLPGSFSGPNNTGGYQPPSLHELQSQNRKKARKFYSKKKFNNRFAPYAPRNTTSFLIRAKKSGGITSFVSPCPVTPAVLPTPMFSPSREALGDMAKEEWGVDGYGSMKGLIRLRESESDNKTEAHGEEDEEGGGGSSDSDVEERLEVERRLDHDLSRFEMIYQNYGVEHNNFLENRVDDQDCHIAQLEEENLTLKERLFLMERELGDLRRKLQLLERQNPVIEDAIEEVVENTSDNESDGGLDMEYVYEGKGIQNVDLDSKEDNEEVLDIENGKKCIGEGFSPEGLAGKDLEIKESDKWSPEKSLERDDKMNDGFVSDNVNECKDKDKALCKVLASDAESALEAKVSDEEDQNSVVPTNIIAGKNEESRGDFVSGTDCS